MVGLCTLTWCGADNHWVPRDFDKTAASVVYAPLQAIPGAIPVVTLPHLVEAGVVTAGVSGTVLSLINWSGGPVEALVVRLTYTLPHAVSSVSTATGANVTMASDEAGLLTFTMPLEIAADAIILRP